MHDLIPAALTATDPAGQTTPAPAPTIETLIGDAVAAVAATGTPTDPAPAPVTVDAAPTPPPVPAAPAPVQTTAAAAIVTPTPPVPGGRRPLTLNAAAEAFARATREGGDVGHLSAALADLAPGGANAQDGTMPDDWIGQLWSGTTYVRRFVDAISRGKPVTSLTVKGWRWTTPPGVAAYAGNKTAIPSNAADTEPVSVPVQRLAGGHDIDRAYFDLADPDYVAGYWQAMAESYASRSDANAAAALLAASTNAGTSPTALGAIVKAALAVVPAGPPSFVGIAPDVFALLAETNEKDALAFLAGSLSLDGTGGLGGVSLFVSPHVTAGTVVSGIRAAASFHELSPPLRVAVANVPNGGIDAALFGYAATVVHLPSAVARATVVPAGTRSGK